MVKLDKSACLSIVRCLLMSNHLIFMGGRHKNTRGSIINWDTTPNWLTLFELMSDRATRQKSL